MDILEKINDYGNKNKYVRPFKWKLGMAYYNVYYDIIKQFDNKPIYQVYGVQRSGNHAVIEWIMLNRLGTTLHCNHILKGDAPRDCDYKKVKIKFGEPGIIASRENYFSSDFVLNANPDYYGKYSLHKNLLILRDPFNIFASYYAWGLSPGRKFRENESHKMKMIDMWKDNAREFIKWSKEEHPMNIPINYNTWNSNINYKYELAEKLSLEKMVMEIDKIPNFGGGSSFHGTEASNNGRNFNQRFLKFKDLKEYKMIFKDQEVVDLSQQIFGEIENTNLVIS